MTRPRPRSTLFPSRRSSDLRRELRERRPVRRRDQPRAHSVPREALPRHRSGLRSEEHTSELQSQFHLVCRLLLEKKKSPPPRRLLSATVYILSSSVYPL